MWRHRGHKWVCLCDQACHEEERWTTSRKSWRSCLPSNHFCKKANKWCRCRSPICPTPRPDRQIHFTHWWVSGCVAVTRGKAHTHTRLTTAWTAAAGATWLSTCTVTQLSHTTQTKSATRRSASCKQTRIDKNVDVVARACSWCQRGHASVSELVKWLDVKSCDKLVLIKHNSVARKARAKRQVANPLKFYFSKT